MQSKANKTNVLVIMCDQLRKDSLSCYGNKYAVTPNIDRLAKQSILCNKDYVANPICMPNRLSIFSGMYPRNHGIWTNGLLIQDEGYTLMYDLKKAGYQTASIGKIHFEPGGAKKDSFSRESEEFWEDPSQDNFHGPYWGFDYVEMHDNHHKPSLHMKKWFYEHGGKDDMLTIMHTCDDSESGYIKMPERLHSSTYVGDRTINYLENIREKDKPFFLVASFTDPHHPFVAPEETYDRWKEREVKKPIGSQQDLKTRPAHYMQCFHGAWSRNGIGEIKFKNGLSKRATRERILSTYAMVELIDSNVGRILEKLEKEGLDQNTIVIFTSDHGELLGDFGLWHKGPFFFDGLINTPLLVKIPGISHRETDALISDIDLAPTVFDLLNLPIPFYMDGISQKEVLTGQKEKIRQQCMIEYRNGYYENDCNSKALVTEDFKYVRYQTEDGELTDLKKDPNEKVNVYNNSDYTMVKQNCEELLLLEMLKSESKKPYQLSLA